MSSDSFKVTAIQPVFLSKSEREKLKESLSTPAFIPASVVPIRSRSPIRSETIKTIQPKEKTIKYKPVQKHKQLFKFE